MTKIKIAIAEDEEFMRNLIVKSINKEKDMEVVIEAEDGIPLIEQLATIKPDIVLMDIKMSKMWGTDATIKINELYPDLKIITCSQYFLEKYIVEMNMLGVKSFISKESILNIAEDKNEPQGMQELFKAIRIVHEGGVYMTDRAAEIVQRHLSLEPPCPDLPDEKMKLLKGICEGKTSKQIGDAICKSHRTVEKDKLKIYQDFDVPNAAQLIANLPKSLLRKFGVIKPSN